MSARRLERRKIYSFLAQKPYWKELQEAETYYDIYEIICEHYKRNYIEKKASDPTIRSFEEVSCDNDWEQFEEMVLKGNVMFLYKKYGHPEALLPVFTTKFLKRELQVRKVAGFSTLKTKEQLVKVLSKVLRREDTLWSTKRKQMDDAIKAAKRQRLYPPSKVYTLSVVFFGCSCSAVVPGCMKFENAMQEILSKGFDFNDFSHMFEVRHRDFVVHSSSMKQYAPDYRDFPWEPAAKKLLGDRSFESLDFQLGDEFIFLYDFGMNWKFRHRVLEVRLHENSDPQDHVIVSNKKGIPPPQYEVVGFDEEGEEVDFGY